MSRTKLTEELSIKIKSVCENSSSMRQACVTLEMNHNTFIRYAKKLKCYKPNQAGKGFNKNKQHKEKLEDILNGLPSTIQTYKLKLRLLKAKIFDRICMSCSKTEWLGEPIPLELHHKDGNSTNHKRDNLELLCPNCHSFTDTYRGKNK